MATALAHVALKDSATASTAAPNAFDTTAATAPFLAVGAAAPLGEDYPCLGQVLLYSLYYTAPGPNPQGAPSAGAGAGRAGAGAGTGGWKGTLMALRELPGPVTCLCDFKGLLLLAVGHRVEIHTWSSGQGGVGAPGLTRIAFFDAPMLVTSLNAIKDYILLGDVHQVRGGRG